MFTGTAIHSVLAIAFAATLPACGGSDNGTSHPAAGTAAPYSEAGHSALQPLFDDDGRPRTASPQQQPADAAARTRSGLYASRAQYEWQELVAGPYTVLVDVDDVGSAEAAMLLAAQVTGLRDMDPSPHRQSLSFFVQGRDPAAASAMADRLAESGLEAVFMLR